MSSDEKSDLAQVAALPVKGKPGAYRVMLITSRETKRWIIAKGWPMKGREDHEAAAQEALEEAGVTGRIHKHPMGAYTYEKRSANAPGPFRVMVYRPRLAGEGRALANGCPLKKRRNAWKEPGLAQIIKRLDRGPLDDRQI